MSLHDRKCERAWGGTGFGWTPCYCSARERVATERDARNVRAELRDRLDRCTDADHGAAFGWLADNHADLVREALDETGAPS